MRSTGLPPCFTPTRIGLTWKSRASFRMSSGMVALNSSVWRLSGSAFRMRRMSGRKPRSSIRSASSSTSTSRLPNLALPWLMWSSSRPGVATTISVPPLRAAACGFWPTPPKMLVTRSGVFLISSSATSSIWAASSRVGASTRARLRRGVAAPESSFSIRGSRKATVLPEPVAAVPSTSRPWRAGGRLSA